MTDTPHLHALAMRAAIIAKLEERREHYATKKQKHSILAECNVTDHERYAECEMATDYAIGAIEALPLEADHAALLAEAKKLPEIAALIALCNPLLDGSIEIDDAPLHVGGWYTAFVAALLALETP